MVASAKPNPFHENSHERKAPRQDAAIPAGVQRLLPPLRLLVIDADPAVAAFVREVIGGAEGKLTGRRTSRRTHVAQPKVFAADSVPRAVQVLKKLAGRREPVDLVLIDECQFEGESFVFTEALAEWGTETRVLVTSGKPSLAASLQAFRCGALDYLPKSIDPQSLAQRVRVAAGRRYLQVKDQRRLRRLKGAVRQLNQTRRTVSRKVDLLCQDFLGAYTELARQMERLRVSGHFRALLESAADLEQLLCHTMDWILRELGHCNIAIYLTDDAGKSELGAYMKHTIAGDERVTRWLARHIIPRASPDGLLHTGGASAESFGGELKPMQAQAILAVDCTYLAESLGTLIVFRKAEKPFGGDELALLKAAGPVFATALTNLVRAAEGGESSSKQEERDDEADWWRRSA